MIEEQLRDRLVQEYLEEARDSLSDFDLTLGKLDTDPASAIAEVERLFGIFSVLRVQGKSFEIPRLDIALHRLCDYLEDMKTFTEKVLDDLRVYSSTLHELLEDNGDIGDISAFTRALPVRTPVDVGEIVQVNVEIMLVEPNKTVSKLVSRELRACGYRVTTLRESTDAITYAVRTKPDMIIASAELGEISGIDLACAFGAMPLTKAIPFALLTSREREHAALTDLPARSAVLKKGAKFGDDLADALTQFGIT